MIELLVSRSGRRKFLAITGVTLLLHTAANVAVAAADDHLVVNTVVDANDANLGDGTCADATGQCSLRAAIQEAELAAGVDTVTFNLVDGTTIFIDGSLGPLPDITDQLNVDATTDPSYIAAGHPVVELDSTANTSDPVLTIDSAETTIAGLVILGGSDGVVVTADDVTLRDVVIGSADGDGVLVDRVSRTTIVNSWIGVRPDGSPVANIADGIRLDKFVADSTITGNVIANNGDGGVALAPNAAAGNTIVSNVIRDNGTQAIDLNGNGRVDTGGGSGPNDLQSFPVITSATHDAGTLNVTFTLDSPAGVYRIDLFSVANPDADTGHGELEVFLGSFNATVDDTGSPVTATLAVDADATITSITGTATSCVGDCNTLASTSEAGPTTVVVTIEPPATTTITVPVTTTTQPSTTTEPTSTTTTQPPTTTEPTSTTTTQPPTTTEPMSATTTTTVGTSASTTLPTRSTPVPSTSTTPKTTTSTSTSSTASASRIDSPSDNLAFADSESGNDGDPDTTDDSATNINPADQAADPVAVRQAAAALLTASSEDAAPSPGSSEGDASSENGLLNFLLAIAEMIQNARPPLWPYYMAALLLIGLELFTWWVVPRQRYFIADHAFGRSLGGQPVRAGSGPYWGRAHSRKSSTVTVESPLGATDTLAKSDIALRR